MEKADTLLFMLTAHERVLRTERQGSFEGNSFRVNQLKWRLPSSQSELQCCSHYARNGPTSRIEAKGKLQLGLQSIPPKSLKQKDVNKSERWWRFLKCTLVARLPHWQNIEHVHELQDHQNQQPQCESYQQIYVASSGIQSSRQWQHRWYYLTWVKASDSLNHVMIIWLWLDLPSSNSPNCRSEWKSY